MVIIGEGEQNQILNYIKKIIFKILYFYDFTDNIFNYYKNSKCFLLSSLWEDPEFVLVESIYMNTFVISSNCKNGPEEILDFGNNGILFNSDEEESFCLLLKNLKI